MKLRWIGHACFSMTAQDGTTVITDPYDKSVGIDMLPLYAELITMSHEHHDHCEMSMIKGGPVIVRGGKSAEAGSVKAYAAQSYHDDAQGMMRGANAIYCFDIDGMKIVHMGDQGCMPSESVLEKIAGADLMLIPVGGTYTVDAVGAKAIIDRAKPRCVVPMHVKTRRCPYPIDTVQAFLKLMGAENAQPADELDGQKDHLPCGVALMKPMADEL